MCRARAQEEPVQYRGRRTRLKDWPSEPSRWQKPGPRSAAGGAASRLWVRVRPGASLEERRCALVREQRQSFQQRCWGRRTSTCWTGMWMQVQTSHSRTVSSKRTTDPSVTRRTTTVLQDGGVGVADSQSGSDFPKAASEPQSERKGW